MPGKNIYNLITQESIIILKYYYIALKYIFVFFGTAVIHITPEKHP